MQVFLVVKQREARRYGQHGGCRSVFVMVKKPCKKQGGRRRRGEGREPAQENLNISVKESYDVTMQIQML